MLDACVNFAIQTWYKQLFGCRTHVCNLFELPAYVQLRLLVRNTREEMHHLRAKIHWLFPCIYQDATVCLCPKLLIQLRSLKFATNLLPYFCSTGTDRIGRLYSFDSLSFPKIVTMINKEMMDNSVTRFSWHLLKTFYDSHANTLPKRDRFAASSSRS